MKVIRTDDEGFPILQGTAVWQQLRVGMLTGTGIGNVLPGKRGGYLDAREKELNEMVVEIITDKPANNGFKASKYMRDGIEREPFARMYLEEKYGLVIEEVAFVRHDWMRVGISPDGLASGEPTTAEIKSPSAAVHLAYWMGDKCPEEYVAQVQSGMWISEAQRCLFCSYHPDFPEDMQLRVIEVLRDDAYIARIEAEVSKFLSEVNIRVKQVKELAASRKEMVLA